MLESLAQRLICPSCRNSRSNLVPHTFNNGSDGHIRDGVLVCDVCREWYAITDDVLELVPPSLLYANDIADFQHRFGNELMAAGCSPRAPTAAAVPANPEAAYADQRKQREHFDRYAEGDQPGFADYTKSVFIRTACARFIEFSKAQLGNPGGWILDIGCGTGNSSFPLAERHSVAAFDISKKVIQHDTEEARARGMMASTTFFVADGGFLSFKDQSFEFVQTFGSLHHLPNPAQAIQDILRILAPGGVYFGVENNKTQLRWVFDLLMKIMPLWVEEAGAEPLISEDMLKAWVEQTPVELRCRTSVFLPPHLFNLVGMTAARPLLKWSDQVCNHLPWLKANGGQLVYQLRKGDR